MSDTPIFASVEHDLEMTYDDLRDASPAGTAPAPPATGISASPTAP